VAESLRAEERLAAGDRWRDSGLVFTTALGTPIEPRDLHRRFKAMLKKAELPDSRFHDLRHSAASLPLALGVPMRTIMELLGRSSIMLTANTYSHVLPAMMRDAPTRWIQSSPAPYAADAREPHAFTVRVYSALEHLPARRVCTFAALCCTVPAAGPYIWPHGGPAMQKTTLIFVALLFSVTNAAAQAVVNGGLTGKLISVSVQAPIGATPITTTVYTAPKSGHFVLTEVGSAFSGCGSYLTFDVTNFGPLGSNSPSNPSTTFTPGLALPLGASVECTPHGAPCSLSVPPTDCYVIGVLEK
jgi:hypothetical protein